MNAEALLIEAIQLLEQAKDKIEMLRLAKQEDVIDGRSLSIAVTNLETAQLWCANARR